MRITAQVSLATAVLLLGATLLSLGLVALTLRQDTQRQLEEQVLRSASLLRTVLGQERAVLAAGTRAVAESAALRAALGTKGMDRQTLEGIASEQRDTLGADLFLLADPLGRVLAVDPPSIAGAATASWDAGEGVTLLGADTYLTVAHPVRVGDQLVGRVVVARQLGREMLERAAPQVGAELALLTSAGVAAAHTPSIPAARLRPDAVREGAAATFEAGKVSVVGTRVGLADDAGIAVLRNRDEGFRRFRSILLILAGVGAASFTAMGILRAFFMRRMLRRFGGVFEEILETSGQLRSSSGSLQSFCTERAAGTAQQAGAVEETRRTMEALLEAARRISDASQQVFQNADRTARTTAAISAAIAALSSQAQKIAEITEAIRSIADKSDLLAVNASLEGTRAGESGRGFTVVATEMRRLAESVSSAAREIKQISGHIREAVHSSVIASEDGRQIAHRTSESAREITLLTEQQRQATEQVTQSMNEVSQLLMHATNATRETERTAQSLAELSDRLNQLTRDFSREVIVPKGKAA